MNSIVKNVAVFVGSTVLGLATAYVTIKVIDRFADPIDKLFNNDNTIYMHEVDPITGERI